MLNENSKYIGQCDNIRSCRFNKNNVDFFKNIDTKKWWEDTLKNSSEISKKEFLLNVNPHEILDSDESFDDFLNNLSDTYNFYKTNNIYFIKTSGTNGFEWFWVKKDKLSINESLNKKFITVYHGTKPKFVSSIKQNGLIDKSGYNQGWYVVSTDFESALFHSHPDEDKGETNVIEFKVPIKDNDKWLGYPYLWKGQKMNDNSTWFALMQKLPTEFITKIHTINYDTFMRQKNSGFSKINENNNETPNEYIERKKRQIDDEPNYQVFVDRIIKELKNNGLENDYYTLSKSQTTFGQSWYIIFKNGLEIRISNHSVTSNNRILDNKYVAFINVHKKYSDDDIKNIINEYIRLKNIKDEIEYKQQSSFNKLKEIDAKIKNNSLEFIENLKNNKKAIFDSGKTFQTIDTIKEKHPDWENVLQLPYQNGFIYYYIKQNNGYGNYNINKEYYNFLVKNNIINKDMINENSDKLNKLFNELNKRYLKLEKLQDNTKDDVKYRKISEKLEEIQGIMSEISSKLENNIDESLSTVQWTNTLKPTILNYLGIEGKVTKKEIEDLQKEIESNYNDVVPGQNIFNKRNDIRQNMFNYEHPLAQANINGVNLRIAEGLIRDNKKTYLLYADGKLIGEFNSVKDIKTLVKYIQDRLVKNTLNEENSDLKGTILKIVSPNIQKHLDDLIKQYGDKAEIIKHIVSAIDDKPEYSLTYEYAKKIKNYFDNFKGNNTSEEYQLHGGIKLKNYINLILAMKRDSISTGKDIRKNMTILNNTHLKSHDKSTIGLTRNPMALKEHIELIENYIPTKKASCGVILNPEKSILLVKRGIDTKWFPGKWALVGGKVDGDEEFKDAFVREVKEETNLDLDFIKYCFNKHDGDCEVALFVAITKTPNDIKINKEHSEYKWCTANEIKELDCVPHIYEDISECLKLLTNNKEDLLAEEYKHSEYLSWKRKNVTIRGIKEAGQENNAGAMLGRGLYTAFLSNKELAKQYGTVKFVVNAIPKKPKVFNTLNEWEIFFYNTLIRNYCKEHGLKESRTNFSQNTTIEDEMQKLGFDGIIIKGREMVNYKPENVLYFGNENQLKFYYEDIT